MAIHGTALVHPSAFVEEGAEIGPDCFIGPFALIGAEVTLHKGVTVKSHAVVTGWTEIGAVFVRVLPEVQLATETAGAAGLVTVGDAQGRLKEWFGGEDDSIVFLRPDRVVGAMSGPQKVTQTSRAFLRALSFPGV